MSERELRVLEAVVQCYIETAEPAGSGSADDDGNSARADPVQLSKAAAAIDSIS